MNKKLVALAVASTVALPTVVSAADAEVKVYGRINNAIDVVDPDVTGGTTNVSNISSRIGVKANVPLGNGLTAHGRYEFSTFTDVEGESGSAGNGGINDTRIGTVGLSGAFGRVDIGNQWSGFYNKVGTHIDPTYTLGFYLYSGFGDGPYRQSNAIKYSNSWGPVSLELDGRLSEDETDPDTKGKISDADREKLGDADGYGISLGIDAGENFYIGLAYDNQQVDDAAKDDEERVGATVKGTFGGFSATLGYMNLSQDATNGGTLQDRDLVSLYLTQKVGSTKFLLGLLSGDDQEVEGDGSEPTQTIFGIYHNLGGGFKLYTENTWVDYDNNVDEEDFNRYLVGMRFDF